MTTTTTGTPEDTSGRPAEPASTHTTGSDHPRKVYRAIRNDQLLLPLPVHPGALVVPTWDTGNDVSGWVLTAAEIDMHHESLLWGQVLYTRETDGRQVRVGVRWNPQQFGLEAQCLQGIGLIDGAALPLDDTDGIDTDALEVSTLKRAQRLVEVNSFIGSTVANPATQDVILHSAGLGLTRIPDPETWSVAEEADPDNTDTGGHGDD